MKRTYAPILTFAMAVLSAVAVQAGSTTVLEGFEHGYTTNSQGQTNIAPFTAYGTPRGGPVSISLYTSAGPGDPRVTEGTHSAKIVFPTDGFGNDFSLSLSDLACSMIENAASSNQPGRYIVRYDVILEKVNQLSYFNEHWFIANYWDYMRSGGGVQTNYGGELFEIDSFSCPVELPGVAMPTNPPSADNAADFASAGVTGITGFNSDQFGGVTEPLNNFTIYIDNIRLIDTYDTPTDTPVVYPLQSFEGAGNLGGATNLTPAYTTLSVYTTNGEYSASDGVPGVQALPFPDYVYTPAQAAQESDFAVTSGTNCLMVVNTGSGYTSEMFSLPFAGTRLQQILNLGLSPAQLSHFTIRWDVSTPYVPFATGGADGDYFQIDYNATTGSILPMSTGRRQSDDQWCMQRQTYSETLDQILYWGVTPSLAVSLSPASAWAGDPFYFDNFVLIDTAPKYTVITAQTYNPATRQFTLTWLSTPGQHYSVQFAPALPSNFPTTLAANVPSGGDFTTTSVSAPGGQAGFLRVVAQ